jgi:cysteinyl-tRNA synthetase, unknown class
MRNRLINIFLLLVSNVLMAQTDFSHINSWAIQLQNINISEISNNNTIDLVVIDYSSTGGPEGIFSRSQISQIKNSGKTVLAYLSIGEAETYRWYWQTSWDANFDGIPDVGAPSWLGQSNPNWLDNYKVRYWDPEWQNTIYSYLDVIISQGFDGIYCDIVDAYYYWEFEIGEKSAAASAMIQFVSNIRNYINSNVDGAFYIVTQNAESVTDEYDVSAEEKLTYFQSIQGQGCEGLFFRGGRDENNNYNPDYYRLNLLNQFDANGIRIFSIEYLTQQEKIDQYLTVVSSFNFLPYVTTRYLDTLFDGINSIGDYHITISGNIFYYSTFNPVNDVSVILSGGNSGVEYANLNGDYLFTNLKTAEDYTVTPSNSEGFSSATILSYDAAMAAQIALGILTPTEKQYVAADVDKNGTVLMYDASLIAQYAVGLTSGSSHTGEWTFNPENRILPQLTGDVVDCNFFAILLGDVDGNWSPAGSLTKADQSENSYHYLQTIICTHNEKISIPIIAESGEVIYSCDLKLRFDPSVLEFDKLLWTASGESFLHTINDQSPGILQIGLFGIDPITQPGKFSEVLFDIIGAEGEMSDIELLSYRINSEEAKQAVATIIVESSQNRLPDDYQLFQNYPNPFNPTTIIKYHLPERNLVVIKVHNLIGEEIVALVDDFKNPGIHLVPWDGIDKTGKLISSGVYIYTINAGEYHQSSKMMFMQ